MDKFAKEALAKYESACAKAKARDFLIMQKYIYTLRPMIAPVKGGCRIFYPYCCTKRWISNQRYDHLTVAQL